MLTGGLRSGAVDTTSLIYNERNSIVAEFCRRVQAVIWNRALIKTENDDLGLASDKVRRGDMVCILYGCTVPVILRKGKWKTKEKLVRKCAENKARKIRWKEKKLTMKESELNEIKMQTSVFNNIKIKEERQVEKNEEGKEERKEGEKEEDKEEEKQENEEEKEDKKE